MSLAKIMMLTVALGGLAGCVQSQKTLGSDFGVAVRQDVAAQIADPDARYPADTSTDGARVGLAQDRYRTGKSIQPSTGTMTVGGSTGGAGASGAPQ
jgi:type IV pilus biogenesis protein CpaD/CtpE